MVNTLQLIVLGRCNC